MRDRQGRFALQSPSDPIEQITALAEKLDAMMSVERQKADRLQSELETERAERRRLDQQATEMRLALTVCLDAMRRLRPENESAALLRLAARTTATSLLKGAA